MRKPRIPLAGDQGPATRTPEQIEAHRRSDAVWRSHLRKTTKWPFPVPAGGVTKAGVPEGTACAMCKSTGPFVLDAGAWDCLTCRPPLSPSRGDSGLTGP